jgi:predicted transcriptional regulator
VNRETLDLRRNGSSHRKLNGRRSNIQIIADMLKVGEKGAGKTEIMYSANMSYTQIQKYLGFLINHGFIHRVSVGNPHVHYQVTPKGAKLLESIDLITEVLGFQDVYED